MAHDLGGSGAPLVVCHATGFHGRAYGPLATGLVARFRVWAIDFRGHGAATAPVDGNFAWAGMRDDLLAVVDALGLDRPFAVGHSMGGCAVLMAALARPTLFTAAYLYEPIVMPPGHAIAPGNRLSEMARRRRNQFASREEAMMRYASRPGLNVLRADALAAYVRNGFVDDGDDGEGGVRLACAPLTEALTFEAEGSLSVTEITGVAMPVVVAAGRCEPPPNPAQYAPHVAAALPRGTLVEHEHLGHFGPLQDPDRIALDVCARL